MKLKFSIIIPVYNRPKEIQELLFSLTKQRFKGWFEVIIVEDGSDNTSKNHINTYNKELNLHYYYKENSGAGASRNFGMERASGNYFIILDSDVILPTQYLSEVNKALEVNYSDAFGGPDAAHEDFTPLQKGINYSMTSFLTTGGVRGNKKSLDTFQPRSFNFGLSKKAFETTQGFSKMKAGEDIDLTFRLWDAGFTTQLIQKAFVYHKRRSTIKQFFKQTHAFGKARPILNRKFIGTAKFTYCFPSVFLIGLFFCLFFFLLGNVLLLFFYGLYFLTIFIDSSFKNKSLKVGLLSIFSTITQFFGYGVGFLSSYISNKLN